MNAEELFRIATVLIADHKGLLAMDESNPTCNKRFARLGIPQTVESRRDYRELIVTTPGLGGYISGAILCDETIRQKKKDGTLFIQVLTEAGIIPGIKVDAGAKDMAGHPGETVTEGLDGLRDRLREYSQMGARFAKWRAVITVNDRLPSRGCIEANAQALARYAALCQERGMVPVIEPEVLMDGDHTLQRCCDVTEEVLRQLASASLGAIMMRVGIAGDHGGFLLKTQMTELLYGSGYEVVDFGAYQLNPGDDYPDFIILLARAVAIGDVDRGVALCGSGIGASIAANKVPGVRAGLIHDVFSAHQGVEDDDMNVCCLGGRVTGPALAWELIETFLTAHFSHAERHIRRLEKVHEMGREDVEY